MLSNLADLLGGTVVAVNVVVLVLSLLHLGHCGGRGCHVLSLPRLENARLAAGGREGGGRRVARS